MPCWRAISAYEKPRAMNSSTSCSRRESTTGAGSPFAVVSSSPAGAKAARRLAASVSGLAEGCMRRSRCRAIIGEMGEAPCFTASKVCAMSAASSSLCT